MRIRVMVGIITFALIAMHAVTVGTPLFSIWTWFDRVLHFFGGMWLALVVLLVAEHYPHVQFLTKHTFTNGWIIVSSVALLGIFWEFFEYILQESVYYIHGYRPFPMSLGDTFEDFVFDLAGAFIMAILYLVDRTKTRH